MSRNFAYSVGALLISIALWAVAAVQILPLEAWPALMAPLESLDTAQILLAYGLMPRLIVALLAGAILGLAGALMQAVLRNPLADPSTLGTMAGAQLAMVIATIHAPQLLLHGNLWVAFGGAALSTGFVLFLGARRDFAPVSMTVAGMLIGMLAQALATALTLAEGHYLLSLIMWNGGALVQEGWGVARLLALSLIIGIGLSLLMIRPLMVMALGEGPARGLGIHQARIRLFTLLIAVGLTAIVAGELGLISFIGLAAPALVRALGARSLGERLLLSPLAGGLLLALADGLLLCLTRFGAPSLPTGALTGLLGGPLLLWLLPQMRASVPSQAEARSLGARPSRAAHPYPRLISLSLIAMALILLSLFLGQGPEGWGFLPAALQATFLPLRATAVLAALAAGALLAIAGAILQRLTANPMAAPEVLGVTGGAALGYALVVFVSASPAPWALALGTGLGGALALAGLLAYAMRADLAPARMLLAGLAIGAFASAVLAGLMALDDRRAWLIMGWLAGGASSVTPLGAVSLALLALLLLGGLLLAARWLEIVPLGAATARALGMRLPLVQLSLILSAGLATGAATLIVGPVSFIGLMAPHLAQSLGLVRPVPFLLGSWILGALLMGLAAFGARSFSYPYDLPLGLFASLIGAPWLIALFLGRKTA